MTMARRSLTLAILMFLLAATASAAILNVPNEHPTIQAGVDAAAEGDTVLLDPGLYFGDGNRDIDFGGKDLTVLSRDDDPATCIIVCQGHQDDPHRGFIFQSGETSQSRVQGLTIRDGWAEIGQLNPPIGGGGAILCFNGSSPVIANCRLTQCVSEHNGGALSVTEAGATLLDCRVDHNSCSSNGAGVYVYSGGPVTLSGCLLEENTAYGEGGGAYLHCADPLVYQCVVSGNNGVGLHLGPSGTILNSTITGNEFGLEGFNISVENTLIAFNQVALADYLAESIYIGQAIFLCNNVYGNTELSWHPYFEYQVGVDGNISADPLFCDPDNWDFHVAPDSPCLDTLCGQIGALGAGTCPALSPAPDVLAVAFGLKGNHPNPFNPRTEIVFALEQDAPVSLEIYDVAGRKVRTLIGSEVFTAGEHRVTWEGRDEAGRAAAAGIYFSVLTTAQGNDSRRMVLLK
jgi:hypothetical protein